VRIFDYLEVFYYRAGRDFQSEKMSPEAFEERWRKQA
jgi:hypothetical protein